MNFFKHHIGDYDSHTAHLSWLEDAAYTRLIRLYYRKEAPIPADIGQACRLVRASTPDEREAVKVVLDEFFELQADGWHNKRCDEEIAECQELVADAEGKRENEKERQARHRERRKTLFNELREYGEVPAYDTPTKALEDLLVTVMSRVTGRDSDGDVTCDATAIPLPITHYPLPEPKEKAGKPLCTLGTFIASRKQAGAKVIPEDHGVYPYAETAGIPREFLALAWGEFKSRYTTAPDDQKKYRDWPGVFLKAVKGNWMKVWFLDGGAYKLTTVGQQAEIARKANVQH